MMKKSLFCMTAALFALPTVTSAASPYFSLKDGDGFKRFSVSAGPLYVKPTGKAQPFRINTSVKENEQSKVGDIKVKLFKTIFPIVIVMSFLKNLLMLLV